MPDMPYHTIYKGEPVSCDTIGELDALTNAAKSQKRPGKPDLRGHQNGKASDGPNPDQTLKLLRCVQKSEPVGGSELAKAVGCSLPALGPVLVSARRQVAVLKIPFDQVAIRVRKGNTKSWNAGPKIQDAIDGLAAKEEHK